MPRFIKKPNPDMGKMIEYDDLFEDISDTEKKLSDLTLAKKWRKEARKLSEACMRCGWDKAPCDTHHIVHKKDGGEYTQDNAIVLCPNCHREAHYGGITYHELLAIKAKFTT
jgi:5-methylcytosine-specific restriction endonuclease McrA